MLLEDLRAVTLYIADTVAQSIVACLIHAPRSLEGRTHKAAFQRVGYLYGNVRSLGKILDQTIDGAHFVVDAVTIRKEIKFYGGRYKVSLLEAGLVRKDSCINLVLSLLLHSGHDRYGLEQYEIRRRLGHRSVFEDK